MSRVEKRRDSSRPPARASSRSRQHPWNRDVPSSSSWDSASYSQNDIFKGAKILRAQMQKQQLEAERDIIMRGAATVKAQLLSSERPSRRSSGSQQTNSSDEWSDPWEKRSNASRSSVASRTPPSESSSFVDSFGSPTGEDVIKSLGISLDDESSLVRVRDDNKWDRRKAANVVSPEARFRGDEDEMDSPRVRLFQEDDEEGVYKRRGETTERRPTSHLVSPGDSRFHGDEAEVETSDSEWDDDDEVETETSSEELTLGIDEEFAQYAEGESNERSFPLIMRDVASEWTDTSASSTERHPPPPPVSSPPKPPPPPADDTPVTVMGRGGSLRLKIHTYNVQRSDELGDDDTYDTYSNGTFSSSTQSFDTNGTRSHDGVVMKSLSSNDTDTYDSLAYSKSPETPSDQMHRPVDKLSSAYEDDDDYSRNSTSYIPTCLKPVRTLPSSPKGVSPLSVNYAKLMRDPAYLHAERCGTLWQTLVAQHVRFPTHWWDGNRSPQMGMMEDYYGNGKSFCDWQYIARHRVRSNNMYKKLVRNRAAPGRLLLHIIVLDLMTHQPVQDIAIGCLHPNARGVRRTDHPNPKDEDFREVWMAVRKRFEEGAVSAVDRFLTNGKSIEDIAYDSPLGPKPRITNANMRAVYGERPPVQTIFMLEGELYECMTVAQEQNPKGNDAPALVLLKEFLQGP